MAGGAAILAQNRRSIALTTPYFITSLYLFFQSKFTSAALLASPDILEASPLVCRCLSRSVGISYREYDEHAATGCDMAKTVQ